MASQKIRIKLKSYELQSRADVVAAISEAAVLVSKSPRHGRSEGLSIHNGMFKRPVPAAPARAPSLPLRGRWHGKAVTEGV